jgi:hypothetical protein
MTPLGPHLTVFLREYLPNQREMSVQTSDTYAYAFQLLVCFAAERLKVTPSELSVEQLDAILVVAFLEHLEKARELRQNTQLEIGRDQDLLQIS